MDDDTIHLILQLVLNLLKFVATKSNQSIGKRNHIIAFRSPMKLNNKIYVCIYICIHYTQQLSEGPLFITKEKKEKEKKNPFLERRRLEIKKKKERIFTVS